jgi:copper(I)-binding protein
MKTNTLSRPMAFLVRTFAAVLIGGMAASSMAHDFRAGELVIDHPYAMPTVDGMPNGAVYFRAIRNAGAADDRLIGAQAAGVERVEIHETTFDGGVARMRELSSIELPAGKSTRLRHGQRYHLMLVGLPKPLIVGERFDLKLRFERAGEVMVKVWVQQPKAGASQHRH